MSFREAEDIIKDDSKGASELAIDLADSVLKLPEHELMEYLEKIVKYRYTMTPLINLCNEIFKSLEKDKSFKTKTKDLKNKFLIGRKRAAESMGDHLTKKGHNKVLTFSYSSTVIKGIEVVKEVVVLESRPRKEGRITCKKLVKKGKEIEYWVDAGMCKAMKDVDAVVVGSDSISYEGFLNKLGTRPLAMLSNMMNKDFFVAADTSKILPAKLPLPKKETHPAEEVWKINRSRNIVVNNDYFEITPLKYANFVTERGPENYEKIKKLSEKKKVSKKLMELHPLT